MYSIDPRRSLSRSTWARLILVVIGVGALVLGAAPAAMAECPLTDPLCLVENSIETEAAPLPSLPPVPEDVEKVIDDAVEKAKDEVDNVVGQVTETIDEIINPGGDNPGGNDGGGGPRNKPPAGPVDGRRGPDGVGAGSVFPGARLTRPASVPSTPAAFRDEPNLFGRIGEAFVEAAKELGFPLALAAIVLAFVMIQNYLDRKDPKLALAPVRPEVLRFE